MSRRSRPFAASRMRPPLAAIVMLPTLVASHAFAASAIRADDEAPKERTVLSGLAWSQVAAESKPGDTILLEKGFHINGRIEGLHGTREKPITIRGADPHVPSAIACEETGLELIRCSWIRVENLYFINPTEAAIIIDGSPAPVPTAVPAAAPSPAPSAAPTGAPTAAPVPAPAPAPAPASAPAPKPAPAPMAEPMDVSIAIAGCRIAISHETPGMDGIRIRHARNVGISQCRFEAWSEAAIDIRESAAVVVTRSLFTSDGGWTRPCGVRALEGARQVAIVQSTFERGIGMAVQAGRCIEPDGVAVPSPATEVNLSRSLLLDIPCPIEVGPGSSATLTQNTIVDASMVMRLDARCGTPRLALASNLIRWTPGRLRTTAETVGGVEPEMVRLDRNLWWSEEVPACFAAIGSPFGLELSPQVIDIDPKLSDSFYRPEEPRAAEFGWLAPAAGSAGAGNPPTESKRVAEDRSRE